MPFGLRNAAQTFQRFMDEVLCGLNFVYAYIDDLLIASSTESDHLQHLEILFSRLSEYGVIINPVKCVFGVLSLDFMGHRISADGIPPLPAKSKITHHTKTRLGTFATSDARFAHVHIDIVGPLPPSRGNKYLLTCVDGFTHWPEAIPLADITADTVARLFVTHWISQFGVPTTITTDRGTQFQSDVFHSLTLLLGIKRISTTAYHPCHNRMVERFHHQLKSSIKASPDPTQWCESLPLILLHQQTIVKEDIGCTPAQLILGCNLRLPGEFFTSSTEHSELDPSVYANRLQFAMRDLCPTPYRPQTPQSYRPPGLSTSKFVFVRNYAVKKPLQPPYDGPFKVLEHHDRQTKNCQSRPYQSCPY
ncbi:uncharacterized protein LOC135683865 [Rhopilema esculentum]|uniref:uncharacterized protein LOC135683865 n=1 Tax=Rhopilema esculentum TaxID=499914 RepID=UPI0031DA1838